MDRKRDGVVSIGEAVSGVDDVLVTAIREAAPQERHCFTVADQVNQLVSANEADPDLGFMARTMALCSLPHHSAFRGSGQAAHPDLADAVTVHPICQEELCNPGRDVSINSNKDFILTL